MPASVATERDPFRGLPPERGLRVPQARVLAALAPADPSLPQCRWPLLTRSALGVGAGYTPISGTVNRALLGIPVNGSRKTGEPHPGLIARGLVEAIEIDLDGVVEVNYRATPAGLTAYLEHVATRGIPPIKDAASCTNDRYR